MIPECCPDINCIAHDADLPFPSYLKDLDYHLIVLGPTFLCSRYPPQLLAKVLEEYDFIRNSGACKVALPQDDYDCSGVLDDWMVTWNVDMVYSVCPDSWTTLYPRYLQVGEVRLGYTCYISDAWIKRWGHPKAFDRRKIDVSYRASKLPAEFGRLGVLKSEIASRFMKSLPTGHTLRLDISVDPRKMIPGPRWHQFIENSRFCLATPSGSSLLDKWGDFRRLVIEYTSRFPHASFEEIELNCFPGHDNVYLFTAISPRNIEAGLVETVQIATQGSYSGLMQPYEHFIPLRDDCSNINDVMDMMRDRCMVEKIRRQWKEVVLSVPRLRRRVIVAEITDFAHSVIARRNVNGSNQALVDKYFRKYESEISILAHRYWLKQRVKNGLRSIAVILGARRVKRWLFPAKASTFSVR